MKINLLSGYIKHIKRLKRTKQKKSFIVLVTPEEIDDVESEWQGSINMIKKTITQMQDDLTYDINHQIDSVKELVLYQAAKSSNSEKQIKKSIQELLNN